MNFRKVLFQDYPNALPALLAAILSFLTLSPFASILPSILNLSVLLLYSPTLFNRGHAKMHTAMLWLSLTIGGSLPWLGASYHALSTMGLSLTTLLIITSINSMLVLCAVYTHTRLCTRVTSQLEQLTLFPALWATLWCTVSYVSPAGQLSAWTPVTNSAGPYSWLIPVIGSTSIDWIVGAWAVVISQIIGSWYMGSNDLENGHSENAYSNDLREHWPARLSQTNKNLFLITFLVVLMIPSSLPISSMLPLPVTIDDATPLNVGCVLPTYHRYKHHNLLLKDYIAESQKLQGSAHVLLWPEGAVSFNSVEERNEGLDEVRKAITRSYVGVSFEETFDDPADATGRTGLRRTGLAVVNNKSSEVHMLYFKRHLVPIAESFSLSHSDIAPSLYTINLPNPSGVTKSEWAPAPNYTRPVPITASICLDFAAPSLFIDLDSRPSLILAPARTWERSIGFAMWKEAKQRAKEIGSMVLWCDGGEGGVSGIAGRGFSDVHQVGPGSWVKTIGLPYPFNNKRTAYARYGDSTLLLYWVLFFGSSLAAPIALNYGQFQALRAALERFRVISSLNRPIGGLVQFATPNPRNLLQSRFARSLLGSLRNSAEPRLSTPIVKSLYKQPKSSKRKSNKDISSDDFYFVTDEDLPLRLDFPSPQAPLGQNTDRTRFEDTTTTRASATQHNASRPSSSIRTHSLTLSDTTDSPVLTRKELADLTRDFPLPPTHIPFPRIENKVSSEDRAVETHLERNQTHPGNLKRSLNSVSHRFKSCAKVLFSSLRLGSPKIIREHSSPIDLSPFNEATNLSSNKFIEDFTAESSEINPSQIRFHYDLVDPQELSNSPTLPHRLDSDFLSPSARTSFIPPSPSWLSRNISGFDYHDFLATSTAKHQSLSVVTKESLQPSQPVLLACPSPISIVSYHLESPSLSPLDVEGSFFAPPLSCKSRLSGSRASSIFSVSVSSQSSSQASVIKSTIARNYLRILSDKLNPTTNDSVLPEPPNAIKGYNPFVSVLNLPSSYQFSTSQTQGSPRSFFIPSTEVPSSPDHIPLPPDFLTTFLSVSREVGVVLPNMESYGKRADVVDVGGEVDFTGYNWFQDPPARPPPPSAPQSTGPAYVPLPGVIEQNDAFDFALSAAPNVLYARFMQYGQLGVLGWCSEFSEMIDGLKDLGFQGSMFQTTRERALRACEEILKLKLDIKMQIIVIYLNSQIARLRRFLDGDRRWDDYPQPKFPLDPRSYA